MRDLIKLVLILVLLLPASLATAVNPDEVLSDPALEARARSLSAEIRCLVCQNQSIDDSDAPLARDLRLLVREKLQEGQSDQAILDHLVERYGEFVLLKPTFGAHTLLLWGAPFAVLVIGGFAAYRMFGKRASLPPDSPPLSNEEQAALDALLERDQERS